MEFIKKFIPAWLLKAARPYYHGCLSLLAHYYYGQPSKCLVVIGITGTAGKSTTTAMLAKILNDAGKKCGYITTVGFFDGDRQFINQHGRSMPGRFLLQRQLRDILNHGCRYAIVEATSEGLAQNRHWGVQFDMVALTNLGPAHLDAHGGFENYKKAKGKLFASLSQTSRKQFAPRKSMVVNLEAKEAPYFLSFPADQKFGAIFDTDASGLVTRNQQLTDIYMAEDFYLQPLGSNFVLRNVKFELKIPGEFNAKNALLATVCANNLEVDLKDCAASLAEFREVAGRMQEIPNALGFKIMVDYAPEPLGLENALAACASMPHERLIHVFGSTGGHRDKGKRFEFGEISARHSDIIVITNDDVYDSDPGEIARDIKQGIDGTTDKKVQEVHIILDRQEALRKTLKFARPGDLILVTGKGSEQFLVLPGNKKIPWDEVEAIKNLLP